jgi:hypothetical protein
VSVQAYDATYLVDADIGVNVEAYDATILKDADIGVTVQAYDVELDNVTADSIAALKLIEGVEGQHITVLSYYAPNYALANPYDGGGGSFAWDATSTETDNGGTIIKVTAVVTGRWIRIYSGAVNVKWFGVTGDGTTDDVVSIQKALNLTGNILFPLGTYLIGDKLSLSSNTTIFAAGAVIKLDAAVNNTMLEGDLKTNIKIYGLELDGNKAAQTIFGPLIGLYLQDCTKVKVIDCIAHDIYGIGFGANVLNNGEYRGNTAYSNDDNGFDFNGDYVTVARTNQGTLNVHLEGNTSYSNAKDGFFVGHGITASNTISNNIAYSNTQHGFHIGESSVVINAAFKCVHNTIVGNIAKGNTGSGIVGFTLSNSSISGNIIEDNGVTGLRLSQVAVGQKIPSHNTITGNIIGNAGGSQATGIHLDGLAANNTITGNNIRGNVTADINTTGSGSNNLIQNNNISALKQTRSGTITTASLIAGAVDVQVIAISGYNTTPDIKLTISSTTGHERFIVHSDVESATSFTIRTVNIDAAASGTAIIKYELSGGF